MTREQVTDFLARHRALVAFASGVVGVLLIGAFLLYRLDQAESRICASVNDTFGFAKGNTERAIATNQARLKVDLKAGRVAAAKVDRTAVAEAEAFLKHVRTTAC